MYKITIIMIENACGCSEMFFAVCDANFLNLIQQG